jgi:protein AIR1/2
VWDFPREPSAFSTHNTMSGPFFDPAAEPVRYQASYRDHSEHGKLSESWGMDAPSNVGKQGRTKDRVKLEKRFREQEAASDPEDWFVNPANARSRGMRADGPLNRGGSHGSKKLAFGASMKEAGRQIQPSSIPERPKLIDRIHDGHGRSKHRSRHGERRGPPHEKSSWRAGGDSSSRDSHYVSGKGQYYQDRDRGYRDRRRDGDRADRRDPGPRYTGGYAM